MKISSYPQSISSPQLPVLDRWYQTYYTTMDHSLGTRANADGPISVPPGLAVKCKNLTQSPPTPTVFHLPSSQSWTDGIKPITAPWTTPSAPRPMLTVRSRSPQDLQ